MTRSLLAQIRMIARAGDIARAWQMFDRSGLIEFCDPAALALKGRLLKDRALRSEGSDRALLLTQAQQAYLQAAQGRRATYPLINAATLAFLNGRTDEAGQLARQILSMLESGDHEPETAYWLSATAAEAHLLLGEGEAALHAMERARAAAPQAWEDHAATLRQFRQLASAMDSPLDQFDHLRPPPSVYFSGIMALPDDEGQVADLIGRALDRLRPGAVHGALAAGADILIAELAVARGAQLHVVLPTDMDSFLQASVIPFGGQWRQRFDHLIAVADSVDHLETRGGLSKAAVTRGAEVAMGLALRRAANFATQAIALHVGRQTGACLPQERLWRDRGLPFHAIVLEHAIQPTVTQLADGTNRIILASPMAFPRPMATDPDVRYHVADDMVIAEFPDVRKAMAFAQAMLHALPECRLGMEYRTFGSGEHLDELDGLAAMLARAAAPGSLWMPWPQAAAFELHGPDCRFEFGGEVITPLGDCPVAQYCLPG